MDVSQKHLSWIPSCRGLNSLDPDQDQHILGSGSKRFIKAICKSIYLHVVLCLLLILIELYTCMCAPYFVKDGLICADLGLSNANISIAFKLDRTILDKIRPLKIMLHVSENAQRKNSLDNAKNISTNVNVLC